MAPPKGHLPYNVNGEGGRPPRYTPEFLNDLANKLDTWIAIEKNLWLKDFFIQQYISNKIVDYLCSLSNRFFESYQRALEIQESRIYTRALERRYDGTMARFGLMNNHGWAEKSKTEISGDANNPLNVLFNHSKELVNSNTNSDSPQNT
jgi:hypothetical protein